jgi:hypothetical protein
MGEQQFKILAIRTGVATRVQRVLREVGAGPIPYHVQTPFPSLIDHLRIHYGRGERRKAFEQSHDAAIDQEPPWGSSGSDDAYQGSADDLQAVACRNFYNVEQEFIGPQLC